MRVVHAILQGDRQASSRSTIKGASFDNTSELSAEYSKFSCRVYGGSLLLRISIMEVRLPLAFKKLPALLRGRFRKSASFNLLLVFTVFLSVMAVARPFARYQINHDFPDPMMIRSTDGHFYAYATGLPSKYHPLHVQMSISSDVSNWAPVWDAMPTLPKWGNRKPSIWAPDVTEFAGRYYMYFSAQPNWSENEKMRLGVAVSRRPDGPFIDSGAPLDTGDAEENIDPTLFHDPVSGQKILYWGRNGAIAAQLVSDDLLHFADGTQAVTVFSSDSSREYEEFAEAPFIFYHDGYYYLFFSGDDCCEKAHYAILVARSLSPYGPFIQAGSPILTRRGKWLGTGHVGVLEDEGKVWIAYHAADPRWLKTQKTHLNRFAFFDQLVFENGWPRVVFSK